MSTASGTTHSKKPIFNFRVKHKKENCPKIEEISTKYRAVVAIDFGTTYCRYAYAFCDEKKPKIHVMGHFSSVKDSSIQQQPTVLLLSKEGDFHSFGYDAQQFYHNVDERDAKNWLYFDKFKMELHSRKHLHEGMQLLAANGLRYPAIFVFAHSLQYFKHICLKELNGQLSDFITTNCIQWVITVPAIWRESAKQFMRKAAIQAGLINEATGDQLIIALEPEAASIYCQSLQSNQLYAINGNNTAFCRTIVSPHLHGGSDGNSATSLTPDIIDQYTQSNCMTSSEQLAVKLGKGMKYMVADCGGGTVDLTLHQIEDNNKLKELYKASGGLWGSIGVDYYFQMLLVSIFGQNFIEHFIKSYPISWLELLSSFEAKKQRFNPSQSFATNITLPFIFIETFRRTQRKTMEQAIVEFGDHSIQWSSQGSLRLMPDALMDLFQPVVENIIKHILKILSHPNATGIEYLFLVGGFSESPVLQQIIVREFSNCLKVIIPQDISLCTIKGAVMYGLNTSVIQIRRAALTYGVGCLHKFNDKVHPISKRVVKDGLEWCTDVFDTFVTINQQIPEGKRITRYYNPARSQLTSTVITLFASQKENNIFITDEGVHKIAELKLDMPDIRGGTSRQLKVIMDFSNTEVTVSAIDCDSGKTNFVEVNFLYKE